MPTLTTKEQRKAKSTPQVINPEGIIRHNIQVWRETGFSDEHIGRCLMSPRLRSRSEFEYWGLELGDEPPMSDEAKRIVPVIKRMLSLAQSDGVALPMRRLEQEFGQSRFTTLRHEDMAIREAVAEVVAHNKGVGYGSHIQMERLKKAERIVTAAELSGNYLAVRHVSLQVTGSSGWLSNCKSRQHASQGQVRAKAAELIDRIKALKDQRQSA